MITYLVLSNFKSFFNNITSSLSETFQVVLEGFDITSGKTVESNTPGEDLEIGIEKEKVLTR